MKLRSVSCANSYMGRAKELVEYLRERIAPKGQATAKAEPKVTEKPAEQATEQASKTEASTEQAKTDAPQDGAETWQRTAKEDRLSARGEA